MLEDHFEKKLKKPLSKYSIYLHQVKCYLCLMSIILAIDYGEVKSGVAVSDESQVFAFGLTTIQTKDLIDYLEQYSTETVSYTHLRAHET